jgi:hypothetical protein
MLARVVKPEGVKRIISEKLHRNGRLELQGSGHFSYLAKDRDAYKTAKEKSGAASQCNLTESFLPTL